MFASPLPFKIAGANSLSIRAFAPSMKDLTGGIAIISHRNSVRVNIIADIARCKDPKQFIQIFENTLDSILAL